MIEQKTAKLNSWFEAQIAVCRQRGQALLADDRTDEAAFEKIRANVYDIFHTILSVAVKTCEGEEAVRSFFDTRARVIPSGWTAAYEKARLHHDPVRMQIEKLKLDTVDEIRERFTSVWEEAE